MTSSTLYLLFFTFTLSIISPLTTALSFPPPTGPYNTTLLAASLTDHSRLDPFSPTNSTRRLMISILNPISPSACIPINTPYMDPHTASFEDARLTAYGLPSGLFETLTLVTCAPPTKSQPRHAKAQPQIPDFPILIFSPAAGTTRLFYTALTQQIASYGYRVITIDHPYDADIVVFPDNSTILGIDFTDDQIPLLVDTRAKDISFVLDQLTLPHIATKIFPGTTCGTNLHLNVAKAGVFGHSLGGAAAAQAMLLDPRLRGGVNLDGSMFSSVVSKGLNKPFMFFSHSGKNITTDPTWGAIWPKLTGWKRLFELAGSAHYSFSDLGDVVSVLGYKDMLPVEAEGILGSIEGGRAVEVVGRYVAAFFDMVLKGKMEDGRRGILNGDGASKGFPEVTMGLE